MRRLIKYIGKCKHHNRNWKDVICYVKYELTEELVKLTEREFEEHQGLNIDEIRKNPLTSGHSRDSHNVARAILIYKYFRMNALYFQDDYHENISLEDLPEAKPDVEAEDFSVWVEYIQ
jgi:hypothetical protein